MDTYSMTQVETLTGINAHTLRIWERRYDFMKAHRTDTNIRFYSGEQLKTLLNVAILSRNGYRISKIDAMSADEINNLVTGITLDNTSTAHDEINLLMICMLAYDEEAFNKIFHRNILRKGILTTVTQLIYPFLNQVGVLWGTNKISPPQEHFVSNLIRQKIISATESLPLPLKSAPTIVLFLLEGEDHELGLLLSSYMAKDAGWNVIYLGQRMPSENIKEVVVKTNATVLLTMLTTPRSDNFIETLQFISTETNATILYSGNPSFTEAIATKTNFQYLPSPDAFLHFLKHFTS
jgi:DNA-binding transcriptional MerR regulator/DNA-directed RNA polymerase subunit L